jgi:hypothetical protein
VIVRAERWKDLTLYRTRNASGKRPRKDELNTQALYLRAIDYKCDLIVFTRDRDGDEEREADVQRSMRWLDDRLPNTGMLLVGGMATECIEAWVLALQGEYRAERLSPERAKAAVNARGLQSVDAMAAAIAACDVSQRATDAQSLGAWLERAQKALG